MHIIRTTQNPNGSYDDAFVNLDMIPKGWALIPENMECPNFPFGIANFSEDMHTLIKWSAGTIGQDHCDGDISEDDHTSIIAIKSENKFLKQQIQATTKQNDFLDDCIAEMAAIVYE